MAVGFAALLYPGFRVTLLFVIISIAILILSLDLIVPGIRGRNVSPP